MFCTAQGRICNQRDTIKLHSTLFALIKALKQYTNGRVRLCVKSRSGWALQVSRRLCNFSGCFHRKWLLGKQYCFHFLVNNDIHSTCKPETDIQWVRAWFVVVEKFKLFSSAAWSGKSSYITQEFPTISSPLATIGNTAVTLQVEKTKLHASRSLTFLSMSWLADSKDTWEFTKEWVSTLLHSFSGVVYLPNADAGLYPCNKSRL